MIHYHGLPITPGTSAVTAINKGHAFVSFAHSDQLSIAIDVAQSFALDNGAFSAWKSGKPITDWRPFFEWAEEVSYLPHCDFVVIPDVIDGDLNEQTALIGSFLQHFGHRGMQIGAPVYHLHEPLDHAAYLARTWPRICIGSSGDFANIGTQAWGQRMNLVMKAVCDSRGRPLCKLPGLRMLDPEIFTKFPFASADSTNIGRNIGIDSSWKGTYVAPNKNARAMIIRERIEMFSSANTWQGIPVQESLI